jgi:phenylalanyl-tRNA synthetase beta chain
MKAPLSWLNKYVEISMAPKELAHELTMVGIEVSSVNLIGDKWENNLVIGGVEEIAQHPNADRLKLATVTIGGQGTNAVVCGADNLEVGQKIAFAEIGANLFDVKSGTYRELKPAKIRGIVSEGMICSELELGIGLNHEGILVLPKDAPLGGNLKDYLGDVILDIEVTPNRPDCLSILGIAREIAAITSSTIKEPEINYQQGEIEAKHKVDIQIHDTDLCKRYAATIIEGVKVSSSPKWLVESLLKAGHNSINNIVDVTNFVMLELGQPLHAFDFDKLNASKINIRRAEDDEKIDALNDENLTLSSTMLTISDAKNPVALAGIIGGKQSSVSEGTTSILIEAANFNSVNVRDTVNDLGVATDASYRFERSPSIDIIPVAIQRATKLILEVAGGTARKGIIDIYPKKETRKKILLSSEKIANVLGIKFDKNDVVSTLNILGFEAVELEDDPNNGDDYQLNIAAPYWRSDVSIPEDLIEEIARIIGYEKIPPVMLTTSIPEFNPDLNPPKFVLKELMASLGMTEIISYPLTDLEALKLVEPSLNENNIVKTTNPMNSEMQFMRTSLIPSVLRTLSQNIKNSRGKPIRLFEMGRVYKYLSKEHDEILPAENEKIVGVLCGPRYHDSWLANGEDVDFYDGKGVLETFFNKLSLEVNWAMSGSNIMQKEAAADVVWKYPKNIQQAKIIAICGELKKEVTDFFDIDMRVILFELDADLIANSIGLKTNDYYQINRFPSSERDISLIFDKSITSADVVAMICSHKLVETVIPVDVYSGDEIQEGKKSVTYRIIYRDEDKTLTGDQVERAQNSILRKLEDALGVVSRF